MDDNETPRLPPVCESPNFLRARNEADRNWLRQNNFTSEERDNIEDHSNTHIVNIQSSFLEPKMIPVEPTMPSTAQAGKV